MLLNTFFFVNPVSLNGFGSYTPQFYSYTSFIRYYQIYPYFIRFKTSFIMTFWFPVGYIYDDSPKTICLVCTRTSGNICTTMKFSDLTFLRNTSVIIQYCLCQTSRTLGSFHFSSLDFTAVLCCSRISLRLCTLSVHINHFVFYL